MPMRNFLLAKALGMNIKGDPRSHPAYIKINAWAMKEQYADAQLRENMNLAASASEQVFTFLYSNTAQNRVLSSVGNFKSEVAGTLFNEFKLEVYDVLSEEY